MAIRKTPSKRFVEVYRGLAHVTPEEVDTSSLGPHWSTEPEVAWNFAMSRDSDGYASEYDDDTPIHGTLVRGYVHRRHIIQPGTPEYSDWADGEGVFGPKSHEREQTIRPGSPVHMAAMHWNSDEGGSKHLNFDQFRRGRA